MFNNYIGLSFLFFVSCFSHSSYHTLTPSLLSPCLPAPLPRSLSVFRFFPLLPLPSRFYHTNQKHILPFACLRNSLFPPSLTHSFHPPLFPFWLPSPCIPTYSACVSFSIPYRTLPLTPSQSHSHLPPLPPPLPGARSSFHTELVAYFPVSLYSPAHRHLFQATCVSSKCITSSVSYPCLHPVEVFITAYISHSPPIHYYRWGMSCWEYTSWGCESIFFHVGGRGGKTVREGLWWNMETSGKCVNIYTCDSPSFPFPQCNIFSDLNPDADDLLVNYLISFIGVNSASFFIGVISSSFCPVFFPFYS